MRLITIMAVLCLASFLAGCATLPKGIATAELRGSVVEACNFYRTARPVVVSYVQWSTDHWNDTVPGTAIPVIPEEQKKLLLELRDYLPKLDAAGQNVCALNDALSSIDSSAGGRLGSVDWDDVLSVVLRVASTAVQLKGQGKF